MYSHVGLSIVMYGYGNMIFLKACSLHFTPGMYSVDHKSYNSKKEASAEERGRCMSICLKSYKALSPPQRPLLCCFDLRPVVWSVFNFPYGASAEKRV